MKFVKQSFMGIELDILTGHPEHDILFIATQVARAAGLKHPSDSVAHGRRHHSAGTSLASLTEGSSVSLPKDSLGRALRSSTVLFTEPETYQMLLRGHAPQSEPFRKWVTEVVLPTIRKTGSFNVSEAQDETSQQFAGEFAALHAEVQGLKAMVQQLLDRAAAPVESPYEGTTLASLADGLLFEPRTYREVGESVGLGRIALDNLQGRVVLALEVALGKAWADEDGRPLKEHLSAQKRKWTLWPRAWAKTKLDRPLYKASLLQAVNEKASSI